MTEVKTELWTCRECRTLFDPRWKGDLRPHCSIECARTERLRNQAEYLAAHPPKPPPPPEPPTDPKRPHNRRGHDSRERPLRNAAIRAAIDAGRPRRELALEYGISLSRVSSIYKREKQRVRVSPYRRPWPGLARHHRGLADWQPDYVTEVLDAIARV